MSQDATRNDYLVLSRGQWKKELPPEQIQTAIDQFYDWYEGHIAAGTMKRGSRLARDCKLLTHQTVTDGPFTEAKEVVGGFWFIVASNLDEAVRIAQQNPTLACGIQMEIRPLDPVRATAYEVTNETPR